MSSRPTSSFSDDNDDFRGMMDAMAQSSPIAPRFAKRTHNTMIGNNDTSDDDTNTVAPPAALATQSISANQNIITAVRLYAEKKRLRIDQITETEAFVTMLVNTLALVNQLKKFEDSKAPFEISADLSVNIKKYAPAVLLSSKTNVYKGDTTTDVLLAIIKKYRFNIPLGLENIPADWAKIVAACQEALTQKRSTIKKAIDASLKVNKSDSAFALNTQHQNIFQLTQVIVKKTQCSINVVLCARVALMRKVYFKFLGKNFWDKLDDRLAKIRKDAKGDAKKITKAFRHILEEDQKTHGKNDVVIDDQAVDEFQQQVDDLIDISALDAATSVEGDAEV
ncbi:hypothetical protein MSAN_02327400 [Mycena sanguinolenta]|uniref:Uncharacterized protein n=1 Tax=Mycena sanguinolenta TaxID=230812 RepID=A0A8H6X7K3_9AGAR|nr:hypothetical protein MSAN_02327400 [Mycena sanguinolenta]